MLTEMDKLMEGGFIVRFRRLELMAVRQLDEIAKKVVVGRIPAVPNVGTGA